MTDVSRQDVRTPGRVDADQDSLQRLLNWLDGGADSDGHAYVEMRRRLRDYFARKNCRTPDDLADETLTRVARRLEEEGIARAETPARYCYIVARFVFLEHLRETKAHRTSPTRRATSRRTRPPRQQRTRAEAAGTRESCLACLEKCLQELDPLNRRIITRYYIGSERVKIDNRRELADKPRPQRECPDDSRVPDSHAAGSVCPAVRGRRLKGFQQ